MFIVTSFPWSLSDSWLGTVQIHPWDPLSLSSKLSPKWTLKVSPADASETIAFLLDAIFFCNGKNYPG